MSEITNCLLALSNPKNAAFQAKLSPTLEPKTCLGIKVPVLRKLAKQLYKENRQEVNAFFLTLPHKYFDENLLHGYLIELIKDYEECMRELERFLPYMNNWAITDGTIPKVFGKHKEELLGKVESWIASEEPYTCRYGVVLLMRWFLDEDFKPEYLEMPAAVRSEEYYVNMVIAWFFATSLAKQWESTIPYLEQKRLDTWTHNKTIQKAIESYRITDQQKAYLRTLKIKKNRI